MTKNSFINTFLFFSCPFWKSAKFFFLVSEKIRLGNFVFGLKFRDEYYDLTCCDFLNVWWRKDEGEKKNGDAEGGILQVWWFGICRTTYLSDLCWEGLWRLRDCGVNKYLLNVIIIMDGWKFRVCMHSQRRRR